MPVATPKTCLDFPDDPLKWDGWSKYKAENPYDRLCLDPRAKPSDELIQQHCTALVQWWQKKVPLKNQPTNPMAQLLGRGIDEASRYLVDGRVQLLDPARRLQVDDELAAQAQQEALAEFSKYVAFSIARKVLTAEAEANLSEFGQRSGLTKEETRRCIDEQLQRSKAERAAPAPPPIARTMPDTVGGVEGEEEFRRILQLSQLDLGDATWLVRRIFATIAENLGIHLERAEHLLDDYLEEAESGPVGMRSVTEPSPVRPSGPLPAPLPMPPQPMPTAAEKSVPPTRSPSGFSNPSGASMALIAAGEFVMGSEADDASPNEQPLTPVTLSEFYMSLHPVTNAQYEQFDPTHRQKRMKGADADYPVVYVSSLEAVRYCQWLGHKDGRA